MHLLYMIFFIQLEYEYNISSLPTYEVNYSSHYNTSTFYYSTSQKKRLN